MAEGKLCPSCGERYPTAILYCPRDGAPLATRPQDAAQDPYVGLTVGDVRLEQLVGIGSMARVYRSHQSHLQRDVAVKVLRAEARSDPVILARFWREARVAGSLRHPGIVQIVAAGTIPELGDPFIVMEYLDGMPLRSLLAASVEPLPLARTLHVVLQIADAVGEAHAAGVVHRDLKPENVMLVRRGGDVDFVKVLDFGIARASWVEDDAATRAGAVLGTPNYLSPEAGRGQAVSPASDVYSLATLAFEALAGRLPLPGAGPVDVLVQKSTRAAPDIRELVGARVPPPIAEWIARNLSRDARERDDDARAAGLALLAAASAAGVEPSTLRIGATLGAPISTGATRALTLDAEVRARMGAAPPTPTHRGGGTRGGGARGAAVALMLAALGTATPARAEQTTDDVTSPVHRDESDETHGMAEIGVGLLSLPTAEVCVERSGAGCSKGDQSVVVSAWPMFRRGPFAVGAGVGLALIPTTDAPRNDPPDLPRDHSRSYLTVELTGRYYHPLTDDLDGWVGLTGGLVVVRDNFQTQRGLTEQALVGPRGFTILTEGGTLGVAGGLSWLLTPTWLVGGHARGSNWFLPEKPETSPLGDEASLGGHVFTLELYVTLAYRARLVF